LFAKFALFATSDTALDQVADLGLALDQAGTESALGPEPADDLVGLRAGGGRLVPCGHAAHPWVASDAE
jgi:hypothetical protein